MALRSDPLHGMAAHASIPNSIATGQDTAEPALSGAKILSQDTTQTRTLGLIVIRDVQFRRRRARAGALGRAGPRWGRVLLLLHGGYFGHGALHLRQAQQRGGPPVGPHGEVARRSMLVQVACMVPKTLGMTAAPQSRNISVIVSAHVAHPKAPQHLQNCQGAGQSADAEPQYSAKQHP